MPELNTLAASPREPMDMPWADEREVAALAAENDGGELRARQTVTIRGLEARIAGIQQEGGDQAA